jgi:putative MFS transporter
VAQTIEGFVGNALDDAKISPLHVKVIALIAAGYFFDVIDVIVFGSLIPDMLASKFCTGPEAGLIGAATVFGMFIGTAGQGEFSDRWGRKTIYQFNLLLFGTFTILGAFAPTVTWLIAARFIAGIGIGAEQPLAFSYAGEYSPKRIRGRILAIVHFVGGACVWPIASLFTLTFRDQIGWRGVWIVIGIGALIVWIFRFWLPESPRYLATHGRGKEALDVLGRMGIAGPKERLTTDAASDTKSDPFAVVFKMFPRRVVAGMICFSAFFGTAIGLGTWLPNIMTEKGFTITKSLTYTFGMTLAVPCASLFMMYALDKFGRKITSVCAFICAGLMAIVFANAVSDIQLLVAGFIMIFFIQVAGNSMQIFASEVFPTNARASGFGWAAGVGRLATAFIVPSILLIQVTYGLKTVFICLAIILIIAAASVTQLGPEAKQLGLDEVEPPTKKDVDADTAFWLKFAGFVVFGISLTWWLNFYLSVREIASTLPCIFYTSAKCEVIASAAEIAGRWAFRPYLTWIGIGLVLIGIIISAMQKPSAKTS